MGSGTNPPDFRYLTYWSIVPGPEQFIEPDLELSFLNFLCETGMDLKLRAEDRPEMSSLRSTLLPVENFLPLDLSFVFVETAKYDQNGVKFKGR